MAPTKNYYNRIIFGAVSAGTGNFVVSAAVTGYRTPATASVPNGAVVSYTAETADKSQWETGQGTYTSATTTINRTTVRENSSGTTALINFASAPIVRLDYHAQDITPDMWVDVRDFIADPTHFGTGFSIDEGLIIQEAIDYAFNNNKSAVFIPPGANCKISRPIWLAPPGSYASVDPQTGGSFSNFQFSMALVGGEGLGDGLYANPTLEAYGVDGNGDIDFNNGFPDYPILIVGPGQGMRVSGINCLAASGSLWPTTFNTASIGIAVSGGPGGASRTMIERCWAQNVYTGFKVGWNEDSLADSNTFVKCNANGCHIGYEINQTQNYINSLYDCNASCTYGIVSDVGKAVQVFGGNYSHGNGIRIDFDISGTTGFTVTGGGNFVSFTTTITFDPGDYFGFAENALTDGGGSNPILNAYAIETTSFGIIPLSFQSYNSTTNAITLFFEQDWWNFHFGINPPTDPSTTDLAAEVAACTILLAAQRVVSFKGPGLHVYGPHLESPGSLFCLLDNSTGFSGDTYATIENPYFNWSVTTDATDSILKLQSVWPVIYAPNSTGVTISGGQYAAQQGRQTPPWLITTRNVVDLYFERFGLLSPNIMNPGGGDGETNAGVYNTVTRGTGHWDNTPFVPTQGSVGWGSIDGAGIGWTQLNRGRYPALGNVPASGITPEITPAFYTLMSVGPPVVSALGTYPPILGNQLYRVTNWDAADDGAGNVFVVSDHDGFSYGQDITLNWSYKGRSNCVNVDDIGWMFPGLKIGLDNGGGTKWYKVLGVYPDVGDYTNPRPGYITVYRVSGGTQASEDWPTTFGTKTTTYTGATVEQESYNFTGIGAGGAATTPGGSDTQVQFNDSSAFGGDAGLVYDKTANRLEVSGVLLVNGASNTNPSFYGLCTNNAIDIQGSVAGFQMSDRTNGAGHGWQFYSDANIFRMYSLGVNHDVITLTEGGALGITGLNDGDVSCLLYRDGSGLLAQRNGGNGQAFRVYATFTDSSNYERGVVDWQTTSSLLTIGSQAAGTGTVRDFAIVKGANTFFTSATTTVGSLPAAGVAGRRHFVTDATVAVFGSVVAGSGGNPVPVYDDGTNWRIG